MPPWPWLILVAIALICPSSCLLQELGGGIVSREGVEIRQAHPFYPQGSPVSSERPEYPQRGGEEGSWTLPVTWLAANVGWGGAPVPLGQDLSDGSWLQKRRSKYGAVVVDGGGVGLRDQ